MNRPLSLEAPPAAEQASIFRSEAEALEAARALAAAPAEAAGGLEAGGWGAAGVPQAFGGLGASWRTQAEILRLLATADLTAARRLQRHGAALARAFESAEEPRKASLAAEALAGRLLEEAPSGPELPAEEILAAAADLGGAEAALEAAARFVREKARPWVDSGVAQASEDPHLIQEFGRLQIDLEAARALLDQAARALDAGAEASLAAAQARILAHEIAVETGEKLFELAGSAATRSGPNLGRFWREARLQAPQPPIRERLGRLGRLALEAARS